MKTRKASQVPCGRLRVTVFILTPDSCLLTPVQNDMLAKLGHY
ncbi:MAG: hypothetical protein ACLQOO_36010 [Terriglobia bacterium]